MWGVVSLTITTKNARYSSTVETPPSMYNCQPLGRDIRDNAGGQRKGGHKQHIRQNSLVLAFSDFSLIVSTIAEVAELTLSSSYAAVAPCAESYSC